MAYANLRKSGQWKKEKRVKNYAIQFTTFQKESKF